MWAERRVDRPLARRSRAFREDDLSAAADAAPERAQAVGGGGAVDREAAGLAAGRRLTALVQRAAKVPSLCSRAVEIFCAAGRDEPGVLPADWAYGYVVPPPAGNT